MGPLAERLTRVAENLQQASSLAAVQVERFDRLFAGASQRADATMSLVHGAVVGPIREGLAVIAALRGRDWGRPLVPRLLGAARGLEVRRRGSAVHRLSPGPGVSRATGGPFAGETLTPGARR